MEDVDTMISKALKLIDEWQSEPRTRKTADLLQMQLTLLKVAVGIDKFNELPSFVRYLDEVSRWISEDMKQHIAKMEETQKLDEAFAKVEDGVLKLEGRLSDELNKRELEARHGQ